MVCALRQDDVEGALRGVVLMYVGFAAYRWGLRILRKEEEKRPCLSS